MNKISRRNFLKVAGAGAAAMGLAACGGSSSSSSSVAASSTAANAAADTLSGTIEYWSSWSETENQALVLKQAADAFTQLHPNVKINFTFNGRDNRNLVVSAIEAGTQIDLMDANIDNVQKLWSENIKDLSSYVDKTYDTTNGKAYKDCSNAGCASLRDAFYPVMLSGSLRTCIRCDAASAKEVYFICSGTGAFRSEMPHSCIRFASSCCACNAASRRTSGVTASSKT